MQPNRRDIALGVFSVALLLSRSALGQQNNTLPDPTQPAPAASAAPATPAPAPAPTEGCNPPCGSGYACKAGACVPNDNPSAASDVFSPAAPAPAPTVPNPTPATVSASIPVEQRQLLPGDENLIPPWIHTSDFVDTRLSFLIADNDMLVPPGTTTPNSPGVSIASGGATNQFTQFYDNYNTKYTGFETLSNLVLYKQGDTYFKNLSYEAALALTLIVNTGATNPSTPSTSINDASSYIRLLYVPEGWDKKTEGISLTTFPLSADRMRLGYSYKLSWGGSDAFPNQGASVPGFKLQLNKGPFYAYGGVKTTQIYNEEIHDNQSYYAALGGAGWDILPTLRVEANGGYFQKGTNPEPQVLGEPVDARGISAEAVYHQGQPVGYSVDFALYKNDPNHYTNFFHPETYPGGLAFTISLEGDFLQQTLADPEVFGQTDVQNATAGAFTARFKYDYLRFNVLASYRSLSYIQFNVPGFPPFFAFPQGTIEDPEQFVAAGADYYFPGIHFTPGIIAGVQSPASFSTNNTLGGNNPPPGLSGNRVVVVSDVNTFSVLPQGDSATLIYSAKTTGRLQISDYVAAVYEVYYTYNKNQTTFVDDSLGIAEPVFQKPSILGFNLLLQARF